MEWRYCNRGKKHTPALFYNGDTKLPQSSIRKMKKPGLLILIIVAGTLSACGDHTQNAIPGYAEADYVRLSSPIGGSLAHAYVKRGDRIAAGAPVFVLEQANERAAREEAVSHVQHAQDVLSNMQKGKRPDEIAAARAQLAQAQSALKLASDDLARTVELAKRNFVAPSRVDDARTTVNVNRAKVDELEAQLRVSRLPARSDDIRAAEQDLNAAKAQLAQSDWNLQQKTQKAPAAAEVVDVLYREGEWVAAGAPAVTLLPPQNIKARFFVSEKLLGTLRIGQAVDIVCDNCGASIPAHVSFISPEAEYTSPIIYSKENRANLVFMVEAHPAPDQAPRLHPGQPLEIRLSDSPSHQ